MTTVSNLYDVLYHYLTCVPHIRGEAVEVGVVIGDVVAIDLAPVIMIGVATPPVAITARVKFVRGCTDTKGRTVDPGLAALHCLPGDPSLTAPFAHTMAVMVVAMTAVIGVAMTAVIVVAMTAVIVVAMTAVIFVVVRRIVELVEAIEGTVSFSFPV